MTGLPPKVSNDVALVTPTLMDFLYVCHHLPQDQRDQWCALTSDTYDPDNAVLTLSCRPGPKWAVIKSNGVPLAIGGYDAIRTGVWQDFLISTEEAWEKHLIDVTRFCRKVMQSMFDGGAHRLQAMVLADREEAKKWYRLVGLEYEGTFRNYGSRGEDAMMYARVKENCDGQ
jgi:RimJ/RimL family protein N-acetyltransferase